MLEDSDTRFPDAKGEKPGRYLKLQGAKAKARADTPISKPISGLRMSVRRTKNKIAEVK